MKVYSIPTLIIASICLTIALSDFLAWSRRDEKRSGLAFILICLGGMSFCLFCAGEYNVDYPQQSIPWLKGQVVASTVSGFALLWFIAEVTKLIKPRYTVLALIWTLLASVSQILDLGDLTWVYSRPFVLRIELPFGMNFVYQEVERGIILVIIEVTGFLLLVYLLGIVAKFRRLGNRRESLVLFLALIFVVAAESIDFLVGIGAIHFIFLLEYAYLATILVVGIRRSNDFIEAALTKKELQKTYRELQESQATLSSVIDSTADMIWSVDSEKFRLLTFNRSFRDRFLGSRGIAVAAGMHMDTIFTAKGEAQLWREIARRAIEDGSYSMELSLPDNPRIYSLSVNPLRRDGKVFGLSIFGQDITERKETEKLIARSLEEKEILLREVYHRTKNNMSVIISLLRLQASAIGDDRLKKAFAVSIDRILSMSLVHDKLYKTNDLSHIDLRLYLKELADRLFEGYSIPDGHISLVLEMESIIVMTDTAINCGLIANEILTNALKYAFPDGRPGKILIQLSREDEGMICLAISDDGIGAAPGFDTKRDGHLGLKLINSLALGKLRTRAEFATDQGFSCRLRFADEDYSDI